MRRDTTSDRSGSVSNGGVSLRRRVSLLRTWALSISRKSLIKTWEPGSSGLCKKRWVITLNFSKRIRKGWYLQENKLDRSLVDFVPSFQKALLESGALARSWEVNKLRKKVYNSKRICRLTLYLSMTTTDNHGTKWIIESDCLRKFAVLKARRLSRRSNF